VEFAFVLTRLAFIYSEKATNIWCHHPIIFEVTYQHQTKTCAKIFVAFLENLNCMKISAIKYFLETFVPEQSCNFPPVRVFNPFTKRTKRQKKNQMARMIKSFNL
jgi:hypothetical protein